MRSLDLEKIRGFIELSPGLKVESDGEIEELAKLVGPCYGHHG